jgi:DNA end-binding protein Ku
MLNEKPVIDSSGNSSTADTEEVVEHDQQVKGFDIGDGDYIMIDTEEVAAVVPDADNMLGTEAFMPCDKVDDIYFDKPYYLIPSGNEDQDAIRDDLSNTNATAIARTVLFRRVRTVLIRPHGKGLIATTLNYDYEVRWDQNNPLTAEQAPPGCVSGAFKNNRHWRTAWLTKRRLTTCS